MATCPTCRAHYPDDVQRCAVDGEPLLPDEAFAAATNGDLEAGQVVGEYRVEGKLGEGGFGAVYRAVHPLIGKAAAIKVLHKQYSSNPQMVSRFIAEARAVNQIRNRNIIDIFSFGALADGRQYYVMELLDGMTLDAYRKKKGRLTPEEAIPLLRGVARALDAAHQSGIAHRDLKPENIFLLFEDDVAIPKLLDFGIAKLLGETGLGAHKTRTGTPMGTPYYMSPEQCRGRNVDHRTDVYSFGIVVFEMLVGKVPFDGEDVMEILVKNTSAPAPRPSEACPAVPPALDAPMLAFLEKEPDKRPASVGAGLDALAAAAAGAGFDVKVVARRSGGAESGPLATVRVGGGVTPAEAEARTMLGGSDTNKTVIGMEAPPTKAATGRPIAYWAAAAALAVAAIGVGVAKARPGSPAPPPAGVTATALPATKSAEPAQTIQPPIQPPPVVAPGNQGAPSASAEALPVEVELTVEATPKVVDVYQGATKLGSSAAPVKVKRADGKVKLTFKAPGYAPQDLEVPASSSAVVAVTLKKMGGTRRGDLEF